MARESIRKKDVYAQFKRTGILVLLSVFLTGVVYDASALEVGEKAPDFTLPSSTGETIRLSQFRGKKHVLLEFYFSDFGPN
jgi:hypothetical protein